MKKFFVILFLLFIFQNSCYSNDACTSKLNTMKLIGAFLPSYGYNPETGKMSNSYDEIAQREYDNCVDEQMRNSLSAQDYFNWKQNKIMQDSIKQKQEQQQAEMRLYKQQLEQLQNINNNLQDINYKLQY